MPEPAAHSFPASHALQLVKLVERWRIRPEELLADVELDEAALEVPHARISLPVLIALTRRARELTAEPGIGFYLGLHKRLAMYGYLGFATMSAGTAREALELLVRYGPTISTSLAFRLLEQGTSTVTLVIDEHVDLGDVHDVATFSLLVGMRHISDQLTARETGNLITDIPFAEPAYFTRFAHLLPGARFERDALRVHFDRRALELPLVAPDRAALALAREACEGQLKELGFNRQLPERVRRLALAGEGMRGIDEVARALHVSSRTLKRRLAAEGVSFSALVDGDRHERALALLRQPDLSLDQIGDRLGYSSLPNFSRAFRRWTGEAPGQYRKRLLRG